MTIGNVTAVSQYRESQQFVTMKARVDKAYPTFGALLDATFAGMTDQDIVRPGPLALEAGLGGFAVGHADHSLKSAPSFSAAPIKDSGRGPLA